jgi:hypothetical protein
MNEALLRDYADFKSEEKRIAKEIDRLKPAVLKELQDAGADELTMTDVGVFVVVPKRTYTFKPEIVQMEDGLKLAKEIAIAKGDVSYKDSAFVRLDPFKLKEVNID